MQYYPVRNPGNYGNSGNSGFFFCCSLIAIFVVGLFAVSSIMVAMNDNTNFLSFNKQISEAEIDSAFTKFMTEYARSYPDETELLKRKEIFASNYRKIMLHNQDKTQSVVLEVNKFADLSDEEFERQYLSKPKTIEKPEYVYVGEDPDPAVKKNWHTEGKVSGVKDQGNCGSCWTFSSTSVIETIISIKDNIPPPRLAEQDLVDCCRTDLSKGCNGGEPTDAFVYVNKTGQALNKDYPYKAYDQICDAKVERKTHIHGYRNISYGDNADMEKVIMTRTMAVGINAGPYIFRFYKSGVIDEGCPPEPINHGVTIVGADIDPDTKKPYWIVRNSWGKNWGNEGHIFLARKPNGHPGTCGISTTAQHVYYKD